MKKGLLLMSIFIVLTMSRARAQQCDIIDSLKVIPTYPTTNDTVRIVCYSTFCNGGCDLIKSSVIINGITINVEATHTLGQFGSFCRTTDTIILGNDFLPGTYTVSYSIKDSLLAIYDTDTLYFTIHLTGISEYNSGSQFKIIPNPLTSSSILQLNTQLKNAEVVIYDMLGKEMVRKRMNGSRMEIEKGSLESGVYFVRVRSEERQWVGKIVVQ